MPLGFSSNFNIDNVQYQMQFSSDQVEWEEGVVEQQLIATFKTGEREVRMIKKEKKGELAQFLLEGNVEEDDLLDFVEMWHTTVMESGVSPTWTMQMVAPPHTAMEWEAWEEMEDQFLGILEHFFGENRR